MGIKGEKINEKLNLNDALDDCVTFFKTYKTNSSWVRYSVSSHNHNPEKEYDVSLSIMKHKIQDGIEKNLIPFKMGLICPKYNSINSQISRNLNKNYHPIESEYYKTKQGENFMIFKNSNLIIFQFPFQLKLFREYNDDIFVDGTFFIAPKFSYQIFITRTFAKELDTTKTIFPNTNIKYCICHYKKSLEIKKKNKICYKYFYKTYLIDYDMKIWNYYNNMEHITNNASESLNNYLNNLFPTKQSFYELIVKFNELEHLSYYDYQRKIRGIWKIKKRTINKANEITKLIDAKCDRNNIINLWFDLFN
ncbi:hypothetical protein H8356DRAFT_1364829 [Neocallimastix lanati (nom. inval.)]|nr:hypothetical protein H8356DRAFT_1364829 [Neocallimastix sp. JGI-2020a]